MSMVGIDLATMPSSQIGYLMTGLVVPRPIAWVSTQSDSGATNLAPHSYFMAISSHPPVVMFVSSHTSRHHADGRKDTLRNVEATGEFVVNFVAADMLTPMNVTATETPPEIDEFALASLAKAPSLKVKPPRVAAAKAALECRRHSIIQIGDASAIFGEVVYAHVDDAVWNDGRIDVTQLNPLSRLGGSLYAELGAIRSARRPGPLP